MKSDVDGVAYGSKEDDLAASKSLLSIEPDPHLKETVISHLMTRFEKLSEVIYQFLDYYFI